MIYTFIAGTNRGGDITWNSNGINDELQERVDSLSFSLHAGARPSEYDEVFVYDGAEIVTVGADYVTVRELLSWKDLFRAGDVIWVGLNTGDEAKYTISAIDEANSKITFTTNLSGISAGEFLGHRIFGGVALVAKDANLKILENIIFDVKCVDFTKLFDMDQIVDTFEDRSARYIINDFCNTFVNYNIVIDQFDYASDGAIQAVWANGGVGNNPLTDSASPYEKDHWGSFASSGSGLATWEALALASKNISALAGVTSGAPTKGFQRFWMKHTDYTKITNYTFRIGSSNADYLEITITPANLGVTSSDETYVEIDLTDAAVSITGTPDWTAVDYAYFAFTGTASTTVKLAGFRTMEQKYFAHYPFVIEAPELDDFNINYMKPMAVIQRLAQLTGFYWYMDYERRLHFFSQETNIAPFNLTEEADNFRNLSISTDATNLKNVQTVEGGEDQSTSPYSESKKGNDAAREWNMKSKFANLVIKVDDQTTTAPAEAGTTTTNIKITGHGLETGDSITNRTRSSAIREITKVDNDNFSVGEVAAQTTGDTISYFDQVQTSGIEGIVDDSTVDYVYNSNSKSIRAGSNTDTLTSTEFIAFTYNERFKIITAAQNGTSIAALISTLGYTKGEIAGRIIRDQQIKSQAEAKAVAAAEVARYGNAIITATFTTNTFGLRTGQLIRITDLTSGRNIDQDFIIQKVNNRIKAGIHLESRVTASSVLYGVIEFFQQLLRASLNISFDESARPINLLQNAETVTVADTFEAKDKNTQAETVVVADVNTRFEPRTPPYKWAPDVNALEWSLGQWG